MTDALLPLPPASDRDYAAAVAFTLTTVSPASADTYQRTYAQWEDFCANQRAHPLHLQPASVHAFLVAQPVTRRTRQRHLAALRKLAQTLALDPRRPEYRALYEALRLMKAPWEGAAGRERPRRALNGTQVFQMLSAWPKDELLHLRNHALLAVLLYTGLRRSEAAALRWEDLDLVEGVLRVRHGKGDRAREASILEGADDTAIFALRRWGAALARAAGPREFVFCRVYKSGRPGPDRSLRVRAVNQIVEETARRGGLACTPHDLRRTLGTHLLVGGAPVQEVQAQLGHQHASTTIQGYAVPADARRRRARLKTGY